MTRITQAQVKIAEAIDRDGPLTATQLAHVYGARISNARRAADCMVGNNYLMFWDGRYSLTKLGRDDVLNSVAADTLRKARRYEGQRQVGQTIATEVDLFTSPQPSGTFTWAAPSSFSTVVPKADPITDEPIVEEPIFEDIFENILDDIFPIVREAVIIDIAGNNIVLDADDAQELRRSLNKFFEGS